MGPVRDGARAEGAGGAQVSAGVRRARGEAGGSADRHGAAARGRRVQSGGPRGGRRRAPVQARGRAGGTLLGAILMTTLAFDSWRHLLLVKP